MRRIGFIGLGIMGRPMAENLLAKGHSLMVYDIQPEPVKELAARGALAAAGPVELGASCDVVFTMVPDAAAVTRAVCRPGGVLESAKPGTVVVDCSSISPLDSRRIEEACRACKVFMLDAPVSGGEPRAVDGTLSFMVGGRQDVFDTIQELLLDMGASAVLVGGHGAGSTAKLANQIMVNLNIAAMGEAMILAVRGGVDPARVFEAVRGGLAGSNVLEAKMPLVLERKFEPGGKISINHKDIRNVLDTAETLNLDLPLTRDLEKIFRHLVADGASGLDHAAIVHYYEKINGASIQ